MTDIANLVGPEFKAMSKEQRDLLSEKIGNLLDSIIGIIHAEISNPEYSHFEISQGIIGSAETPYCKLRISYSDGSHQEYEFVLHQTLHQWYRSDGFANDLPDVPLNFDLE